MLVSTMARGRLRLSPGPLARSRRSPRCRGDQGRTRPQRRSDHQRRHRSCCCTHVYSAYPYAVGAHAVTYAGAPHAVAHTPFGVTHSSNVGICTNVKGAVVPCRRKREADPALVYSTVGAVPYTYGVLPYAGVHGTNPVHAVAHTAAGLTHSSNVGICTNYVGAVVPC